MANKVQSRNFELLLFTERYTLSHGYQGYIFQLWSYILRKSALETAIKQYINELDDTILVCKQKKLNKIVIKLEDKIIITNHVQTQNIFF